MHRALFLFALIVGCAGGDEGVEGVPGAETGSDDTSAGDTSVLIAEDTGSAPFEIGPDPDTSTGDVMFSEGGFSDAKPEVSGDACIDGGAPKGAGPLPHKCAPLTANECAGGSDLNPALPNGLFGNGYDDDCDGIVDEGCACDADHAPGTTKDCFLVPSSQASPTTKLPVGWCTDNSRGTMACVQVGSGEFVGKVWDGKCAGAQPPFASDVCAPGDYDCDGLASNSPESCDCSPPPVVTCPTAPIVVAPYPYADDLEKKKPNPLDPKPTEPFIIDGWKWIGGGAAASSTNWKWTVTGGDCDNILPHPTFALYNGKNSTTAARIGAESSTLGPSAKQKGLVTTASSTQHQIWPAFSLSGDYVVQGEFELAGKAYACTQKVRVRWPGVRAELCWDTKGGAAGTATDVDLHFARLQGTSCASKHGWFDSCGKPPSSDDCYWRCDSGCRTGNAAFCTSRGVPAPAPGWGYTASTADACHGWGSLREAAQPCDNPRLDRDNFACDVSIADIQNANYCGPENINVDNPGINDQFVVGAHYYRGARTTFPPIPDAVVHPHVNVYCNGERKLSLGYDPTTAPVTDFPRLTKAYDEPVLQMYYTGDFWEVARVKWNGLVTDPCLVEPVKSKVFKTDKDGSPNACVDTNAQNKAAAKAGDLWLFTPGGGYPLGPATASNALCWH